MRENELRKLAKCGICAKPIGHTGLPMFWTVTIERHGLNHAALTRQQGLALQLGGSALLAAVMGPDEEMTTPLMDPVKLSVCETCAVQSRMPVAAMGA